jgi:hypothetical protein
MARGTWQGSGTWQTSGGMTAGGVAGLIIVALAIGWAGKHARGITEATVITAVVLGAVCLGAVVAGVAIAWRSMRRRGVTWTPASPPASRQAVTAPLPPQVSRGTPPAIENHYHVHHHYTEAGERESAAVIRREVQP